MILYNVENFQRATWHLRKCYILHLNEFSAYDIMSISQHFIFVSESEDTDEHAVVYSEYIRYNIKNHVGSVGVIFTESKI